MELEEWLKKHLQIETGQSKGLHVIDTCGKCKNLDGCPIFLLMLLGSDDQDRERLIKNFGCIDFEQKEAS